MREDDVVLSKVLNHLPGPLARIEHHKIGVGVDGAEHVPIDTIQKFLSINCILPHTGPDMLGIAECGGGSPCCDNVDSKRQSTSSEESRSAGASDAVSDAQTREPVDRGKGARDDYTTIVSSVVHE